MNNKNFFIHIGYFVAGENGKIDRSDEKQISVQGSSVDNDLKMLEVEHLNRQPPVSSAHRVN